MFLRYVSDLHLEYLKNFTLNPKLIPLWKFNQEPNTQYNLALCGDIGTTNDKSLEDFLSLVSPYYDKIFYVPGNHEYFSSSEKKQTMNEIKNNLRLLVQKFHNIILLDNESYLTANGKTQIKFIGSTLWTHIPDDKISEYSNLLTDYHKIFCEETEINNHPMSNFCNPDNMDNMDNTETYSQITCNFTPYDTNRLNQQAIKFLEAEIDKTPKEHTIIVLSHHAPLFNDPEKKKFLSFPRFTNAANRFGYHNDLSYIFNKNDKIRYWIYGHTHYVSDFQMGNTRVVSNQFGYAREHDVLNFNVERVLDCSN
jgi:predicted phosphodiesterase